MTTAVGSVRRILARTFPDVYFDIRVGKDYVSLAWTDGPTEASVRRSFGLGGSGLRTSRAFSEERIGERLAEILREYASTSIEEFRARTTRDPIKLTLLDLADRELPPEPPIIYGIRED